MFEILILCIGFYMFKSNKDFIRLAAQAYQVIGALSCIAREKDRKEIERALDYFSSLQHGGKIEDNFLPFALPCDNPVKKLQKDLNYLTVDFADLKIGDIFKTDLDRISFIIDSRAITDTEAVEIIKAEFEDKLEWHFKSNNSENNNGNGE